MHPSLAWRSTILQIAWLAGVIALALSIKEPAIQYTLIGAFAGYGGALIQKARASAGGGGDAGSPGGLLPGPFVGGGSSLPPGPMARKEEVNPLATTQNARRFAFAGALLATIAVLVPDCKGTAVPTAQLVEAGAPLANDTCALLEAVNDKSVIEAICAALPVIEAAIPLVIAFADHPDAGACETIPGTTHCLTNAQRLALIRHIAAMHDDGGLK